MTQQRPEAVPPADVAIAYVRALGDRMVADGCRATTATWHNHPVLLGSRSDRKARWFGTKSELFVLAAAVPAVDEAALVDFTKWAMAYASSLRSGIGGARNAAMVLPALVSTQVAASAREWATKDARVLGTSVIGRPITVEAGSGVTRVTMYRGGSVYGGMFTRHVLEKAALYFS
ncbi:hypothetical protein [Streptomyces sp. NPDC048111]|uniref:hypothetical protein n=1 Tax=Streptomyces sp. NPDC048111 TaxID=3365500 RepID=UPI00371323DE